MEIKSLIMWLLLFLLFQIFVWIVVGGIMAFIVIAPIFIFLGILEFIGSLTLNNILNGIHKIPYIGPIISGIIAKEQAISTITVLGSTLNIMSAYSFCVFNIITIPCINTLTCIKKEFGKKILLLYLTIYLLISYIISIIIYRILIVIF